MSAGIRTAVEPERATRGWAENTQRPETIRRRRQCVCGQVNRVWGSGRHRIYWPLEAPENAPVMDGCCVSWRRPLPGKKPHCKEQP